MKSRLPRSYSTLIYGRRLPHSFFTVQNEKFPNKMFFLLLYCFLGGNSLFIPTNFHLSYLPIKIYVLKHTLGKIQILYYKPSKYGYISKKKKKRKEEKSFNGLFETKGKFHRFYNSSESIFSCFFNYTIKCT